ncbi:MAG: AMP-binding protein, partial [Saccharolobus sp.]
MQNEDLLKTVHEFITLTRNKNNVNQLLDLINRLNNTKLPQYFNWVNDVYEEIHVKQQPSKTALIWHDLDTKEEEKYTYTQLIEKANQLLNFLRSRGLDKGSVVYLMTPIIPEQWISFLALLKGGMIIIP